MLCSAYTLCTTKILPMIYAALGFGILITVHEFGHYIFAKIFNVHTPIFSIGFGPSLIKRKIGTTEFRLSLIPLGGYCMIDGGSEAEMDLPGEDITRPADEDTFTDKAYWKKFLIMFGGIMLNIIFSYVAFTAINVGTKQISIVRPQIATVTKSSAAEAYNLCTGDIINAYSLPANKEAKTFGNEENSQTATQQFIMDIMQNPGKEILLEISRNGENSTKRLVIEETQKDTGSLGIRLKLHKKPVEGKYKTNTLMQAIKTGIGITHSYIKQTVAMIASLFKRKTLGNVGGPVELFAQSFRAAKNNLYSLIQLLGVISISLAITNLIPFGPLDGSQILLVTIEAIIRRPLPERLKMGIALVGWITIMLLIVVLAYRDVLRIFGL